MSDKNTFIVIVSHNTSHGVGTNICLITSDFDKALRTARNVEALGYRFITDQTCITIHIFEPEKVYKLLDFSSYVYHPLVVVFKRAGEGWMEDWKREEYRQ